MITSFALFLIIFWSIVAIIIAAVVYGNTFKRGIPVPQQAPSRKLMEPPKPARTWGKRIVPQQGCCDAVKQMSGKAFPRDEVPGLPVPGCTFVFCTCSYASLPERRKRHRRVQSERRAHYRFDSASPDRRSGQDRRRHAY